MATFTVIPLREYLETTYRPDRDWIEGEVRERNMGERQHAMVQKFFIRFFANREEELGICVLPEQRVQTSPERFRIPDVTVIKADDPFDAIVTVAPLLCIEVLSKDDRMSEMQERVEDYLAMGVAMVWIVDPRRRKAFQANEGGLQPVNELTLPHTKLQVPLTEVFAELDRLERRA